ncbi:reverse transcriptase RNA-dependent DNA polymerase [Nitzschia inconspicua]|uniref:Reverse transcriptase RNA-dependent DNA polymerase n=1 Tax=Nitzschia inconspicua TaxID=303405 RepID=A0A9K3LWG6_9STRA|nr:reverse transcriptase RNA-dependent DNA polymerase [Nitzschia inconspicua]
MPHSHLPHPSGGDYTSIRSIGLSFLRASHDVSGSMQRGLSNVYAEDIGSIDALFHTATADRDHVAGDAMDTLYSLVVAMVETQASETPVATQPRIPVIVNSWRLKYHFENGHYRNLPLRTGGPGILQQFLDRSITAKESDPMIYVQTSNFYVTPDPSVHVTFRNFDHFDSSPFPVVPSSGSAIPPSAPAVFHFNPSVLPQGPRERYEKRICRSQHVCGADLTPFVDAGLERNYSVDPITGQYFVLRDGTLFELKPLNEKGLHRSPPRCVDTSGPGFRFWYEHFMGHCMSNGYYVHPYILFGRDGRDLPASLSDFIESCSLAIWSLLSQDKMFPDKSVFQTLVRKTYGRGYEALRHMIMRTSPLFAESPGDHVRSPPNQLVGKTLLDYHVVFRDYLAMSALVHNTSMSLDEPRVMDMFLAGTLDYTFFRRVSREERQQPSRLQYFRDETIVATLEAYMLYPDYVPAPTVPATPRPRAWQSSSSRPPDLKSLHLLDLAPAPPTSGILDSALDSSPSSATHVDSPEAHLHALGPVIPPDDADLAVDQKYRAAVYALHKSPSSLTSPCMVCGDDHRFDDCPVLQNVAYLRDHYIKFCGFLKRALTSRHTMTHTSPPFLPPPSVAGSVHSVSASADVHAVSSTAEACCAALDLPISPSSPPVLDSTGLVAGEGSGAADASDVLAAADPDLVAWNINAVDFQPLGLQLPFDDVYAIDDPTDPLPADDTPRTVNWTSSEPHAPVLPTALDGFDDLPRAQMDDAAQVSCSNDKTLLHRYRPYDQDFPCPIRLKPAVHHAAVLPEGQGYIRVPAPAPYGYHDFLVYYSPLLNATLLSESDLYKALGYRRSQYSGVSHQHFYAAGTWTATAHHKLTSSKNVVLHGIVRCGQKLTLPLIRPSLSADDPLATAENSLAVAMQCDPTLAAECDDLERSLTIDARNALYRTLAADLDEKPPEFRDFPFHQYISHATSVMAIRATAERLLWHQRLGHPSDHYLYHAHEHITGVPRFRHFDPILEQCPTCIRAKQTKESAGAHSTRTATQPFQGLSIDFSFAGVRSKDVERKKDFTGLNGETCWILVTDHFTRAVFGDTRVSKASPIEWLRSFLHQYSPQCQGKYVYLDQGGELYANPAVRTLFAQFGYAIRPTGADASNQNGPVERAHLTVANALRAMLLGAGLDPRFWPYAFHHFLRITNATPSRDQVKSPFEILHGEKEDFTGFRTFGCRVWVRPPGRRRSKLLPNARKGIFLGFLPNTTKNILWYDVDTGQVKIAKHARFDEGLNDLPFGALPPNVQHLQRVQSGEPFPAEVDDAAVEVFTAFVNPFSHTLLESLTFPASNRSPTFGFDLLTDELNNRVFVAKIRPGSPASRIRSSPKATNNALRGAYLVAINDVLVFTKEQALLEFRKAFDSNSPSLSLTFAPEKRLTMAELRRALADHREPSLFTDPALPDEETPVLTLDAIRSICSLRFPESDFSSVPVEDLAATIHAVTSTAITPAEQALGFFTRRKLQRLSTWPDWQRGEFKQLDRMNDLGMFGAPVVAPPGAIILRLHWQYQIKRSGERRSRSCCDGSLRAAPLLHQVASTYSSCVEQPIQRMFFALAAAHDMQVYGGDATDAFAHSPPPETPTFIMIDDAYAEWYKARFGITLDRNMVLPVLHALQGHPESGRLWETYINKILSLPELSFKTTTHDRTIYSGVFEGEPILLLRQVDDFALACRRESTAKAVYDFIGTALQQPNEAQPPFTYLGLLSDYNGVDVHQTADYIELTSAGYIDRLLRSHGWDTPSPHESSDDRSAPLPVDAVDRLYQSPAGPSEGSPEHAALCDSQGFSYRTLLGELLYAYITCRPDIGYAVVTLSKFASAPHAYHYNCLKGVARYLRRTKHWGIRFARRTHDPSLPPGTPHNLSLDPSLPAFPSIHSPLQLTGYVDAAHANDLRNRRSTTGYAFVLNGGAIAYRSKTQTVTATSSTAAEFIAAVSAAKTAKYLRAVLHELSFPQLSPPPSILIMSLLSKLSMLASPLSALAILTSRLSPFKIGRIMLLSRHICLAGYPRESHLGVLEASSVYKKIGLADDKLLTVKHTRDAKPEEVSMARVLLETAILALQDMIASLSKEDLSYCENPNENVNKKPLHQASEKAKKLLCKVPGQVSNHDLGEKQACLITFGDQKDADMHPAPDPLLLVLKAANIFGIMAGMEMLANASSDSDSDVSTGDIIEEEAFLEAREQALRPKTWEDLARGLGQPNGYLASINDLH